MKQVFAAHMGSVRRHKHNLIQRRLHFSQSCLCQVFALKANAFGDGILNDVTVWLHQVVNQAWVPKDKQWKMPDKYLKASGALGTLLKENPDWVSEPQDAKELFKKVAHGGITPGQKALLEQLPHDWFVELGFRKEAGQVIEGLNVGKQIGKKIKTTNGVRLIGPSTFLNQLNQTLTGSMVGKEWMLILDWVFENKLKFESGVPVLHARPLRWR